MICRVVTERKRALENEINSAMSLYLHSRFSVNLVPALAELPPRLLKRSFPFRGGGQIETSLYLLCKAMKEDATVGISGESADEVFGGYPWFHDEAALNA